MLIEHGRISINDTLEPNTGVFPRLQLKIEYRARILCHRCTWKIIIEYIYANIGSIYIAYHTAFIGKIYKLYLLYTIGIKRINYQYIRYPARSRTGCEESKLYDSPKTKIYVACSLSHCRTFSFCFKAYFCSLKKSFQSSSGSTVSQI